MMLLGAAAPARLPDSNQHRSASARAAASTPEESYDRASPFRGRKSLPPSDCCNTTAPAARVVRRDPHLLLLTPIRIARERFALPTAAGWQSRRSAGKTVPPAFRRARDRRRWFALPRRAAESLRPSLESAA